MHLKSWRENRFFHLNICVGSSVTLLTWFPEGAKLCILRRVYEFIGEGSSTPRLLLREVRAELEVCRKCVMLVHSDLGRPSCKGAYCSDSSTQGCALHVTPTTFVEVFDTKILSQYLHKFLY